MWGSVVILRSQKRSASKRPGRDLELLFSLPIGHFSKGFLINWQKKKKDKLVAFQLDDWPAKDWDSFQALRHRHEECWLSSSCLPSVRMCQIGLHWTDFREIWYWPLLLHSVEQSYVWLKPYKNVGLFTWRPKCIIIVVEIFFSSTTTQNNALLNIHGSCFNVYVFNMTYIACKFGLCTSVLS